MRIVVLIFCVFMLASCSHLNGPSPLPVGVAVGASAPQVSPGGLFKTLFRFDGKDGSYPNGSLIVLDGRLYGTTFEGGSGCYPYLCGIVFEMSTSGQERVIYNFRGGKDGERPAAGLVPLNGMLYGTTTIGSGFPGCGGSSDECGTVFAMSTAGKEHILHRFKSTADGAYPSAPLTLVNGILYGTTPFGGAHGHGTVFAVTEAGEERVVYSFKDGADGAAPFAALIAIYGKLYGTTGVGGDPHCTRLRGRGCGTVFSVSTSGEEHVLYRFKGGIDGAGPDGSLVSVNGTLYGTTYRGGGSANCYQGCGTVFKVSTSGEEHIVYHFPGPPNGAYPSAPLVALKGTLYGTTASGGVGCSSSGILGCGTVFAVSLEGKERVLHRFKGTSEGGATPNGGLISVDGALYGTTTSTVFRISP